MMDIWTGIIIWLACGLALTGMQAKQNGVMYSNVLVAAFIEGALGLFIVLFIATYQLFWVIVGKVILTPIFGNKIIWQRKDK